MTLTVYGQTGQPPVVHGSASSSSWLLAYAGKSTNKVRWDPRLPALLEGGLPHVRIHWHADFCDQDVLAPENALLALSGPPEIVSVESHRYVVLAAAVPHVGECKGMLWVDTGESQPTMIFAALSQDTVRPSKASLILLARQDLLGSELPPQFVAALLDWLTKKGITQITSFSSEGPSGKSTFLRREIFGSLGK
ncbi:MAG: hypothetical protein IRZ03_14790 [Acidobacterium ailaaui]|nr:hypothetical protein [Pseudacidobacterium ailaaui]